MNRTDHFLSRFMLQKHHGEQSSKAPETRDAVVIIPLISRAEGWSVLFTQRSWQLRHHPGQVCFPGGRKDTSDTSLQMTGLRELEEELGIPSHQIQIIGELTGGQTLSGYHIHPYLARLHHPFTVSPAKAEVEAVFELPLELLLDTNNYQSLIIQRNNKPHKIIGLTVDNWFIWGATAKMLYQLAKQYG